MNQHKFLYLNISLNDSEKFFFLVYTQSEHVRNIQFFMLKLDIMSDMAYFWSLGIHISISGALVYMYLFSLCVMYWYFSPSMYNVYCISFRYVGRKRLFRETEAEVPGTHYLVYPNYSYWTLSYILSGRGTKKLLDQNPLSKMLPVDEYLPIMFDKHPT